MFWGLIMEPGRCYTQKVKVSFHVSMAALDVSNSNEDPAQVMCVFEGRNYLLCTLKKKDMVQCPLDLNFEAGSKVSFATNGKAHVHLTGYLTNFEDDEELGEGLEEEEEEEEAVVKKDKKRGKKEASEGPPTKKSKTATNNLTLDQTAEEESDDSDFDISKLIQEEAEDDEESGEEEGEEEEEEDEDDDDDEDEEEEDEEASSLSGEEVEEEEESEEEKEVKPKQNGIAKTPQKKAKDQKAVEKTPKEKPKKQEDKKEKPQKQKKAVLKGGVVVQDIKEGTGEPVKEGKFVHVYYEGRLKDNNKMFDSTTKGPGFSFRVGKGEVIKGWDIGLVGMKVGGKRRITCPPKVAYGPQGSLPVIPPNSTLIFDVEVKKIS